MRYSHARRANIQFAHIAPNKAIVLLTVDSEWAPIWKKFPSVKAPSRAAIEAYAVGLNEAAVYHMMMTLEPGLAGLKQRFGESRVDLMAYGRTQWS